MAKLELVVFAVALCVLGSFPAYAYVDPGSGTLLIQMLIAGAVGVTFYFRKALLKVTSLFTHRNEQKPDAADDRTGSEPEK